MPPSSKPIEPPAPATAPKIRNAFGRSGESGVGEGHVSSDKAEGASIARTPLQGTRRDEHAERLCQTPIAEAPAKRAGAD